MSVVARVPRPYRSTASLGRALRILLACDAVVAVVNVIGGIASIGRIHAMTSFGSDVLLSGTIPRPLPAGLSLLLSFVGLAAGVVWLVWQHRAQSNLFAMRVPGLRYTPGWCVGWWFVPVANLWMPYLTTRELWQGSGAGTGERDRLLQGWWFTWVATSVVGIAGGVWGLAAITRSSTSGFIVGYRTSTLLVARELAAVAYAIRFAGALAAIGVIRRIDEAQAARVEQGVLVPPRPDPPRPDVGLVGRIGSD
jgi:Domain of unknown function (DUF4328)